MKAIWKRKWLAALRSGAYKQGTGWLKTKEGYCCLGVLADVAGIRTRNEVGMYIGDKSCARLGLPKGHGIDSVQAALANRNDGANKKRRWKFPEIADWIEANL